MERRAGLGAARSFLGGLGALRGWRRGWRIRGEAAGPRGGSLNAAVRFGPTPAGCAAPSPAVGTGACPVSAELLRSAGGPARPRRGDGGLNGGRWAQRWAGLGFPRRFALPSVRPREPLGPRAAHARRRLAVRRRSAVRSRLAVPSEVSAFVFRHLSQRTNSGLAFLGRSRARVLLSSPTWKSGGRWWPPAPREVLLGAGGVRAVGDAPEALPGEGRPKQRGALSGALGALPCRRRGRSTGRPPGGRCPARVCGR